MSLVFLSALLGVVTAGAPIEMVIGETTITVEVADDPRERQQGLMGRSSLPPDHGMLFVYTDEKVRSFWMKNTPLPLSVAFINRLGQVVRLADLTPLDTRPVSSEVPAMYALEMTKG